MPKLKLIRKIAAHATSISCRALCALALHAAVVTALLCCNGCASSATPADLYRVSNIKPTSASSISNIRLAALKQTSRGLGAQAGLAWRSQKVNIVLEQKKHNLNQVFNFSYLILNSNVLPPVLTEGQNILNLADDQTIRIADHDYQIVYPPRFITAPPTWRDYLWMNYKKPELPNSTLLPKNSKEAAVWNQYVRVGWEEGIAQANEIFNTNLNRLTRDIKGMVLYRKLLRQNMVSAPFVAETDLGVTGGGNSMRVNDKVLRITSTSELKANSKVWQPVVAKKRPAQYERSYELRNYPTVTKDKI